VYARSNLDILTTFFFFALKRFILLFFSYINHHYINHHSYAAFMCFVDSLKFLVRVDCNSSSHVANRCDKCVQLLHAHIFYFFGIGPSIPNCLIDIGTVDPILNTASTLASPLPALLANILYPFFCLLIPSPSRYLGEI
jgi:hypothetical protein